MKNNNIYTFLFIIILISNIIQAQNFINGAESVAYDSLNNRYLVSSLNTNQIFSIDKEGNQSVFKNNIASYGNCIVDSILYVTGNSGIRGINVNNANDVFSITVPGVIQFDGITFDNSGYLYALATRIKKIYKIDIEKNTYSLFVDGGFGAAPQDLIFDKFSNRLLICQWHTNSSILSVNLSDSTLSTVVDKTVGFADGITIDQYGNVYVSFHANGGNIYQYDNSFSKPGQLIYNGIDEPTGLDYNVIDNVLAIPSFSEDRVEFLKMPNTYLFPKIGYDIKTGHAPLTVTFSDLSSSNPNISEWHWDFDNNNTVTSQTKDVEWTFTEPGNYFVKATFISDSLTKSIELEDSIRVFNGVSSLNLSQSSSLIKVAPSESIDFNNEWTFETWINPTSLHGKYILDKGSISIYTNRRSSGLNKNSLVIKLIQQDDSIIRFSTEDSSLSIKKWNHISLSYTLENKALNVYINGKLQELSIDNAELFSQEIKSSSLDTLIIGNNFSSLRGLKGMMDEIRFWNKALSKETITENILTNLNGNEENLAGLWNLDEGSGNQAIDLTINNNVGLIANSEYDTGVNYNSVVGVKDNNKTEIIADKFQLMQNYPNPFNPTTTIQYALNLKSVTNVQLKIYDLLGREIKTLVNKEQGKGFYNVTFDASHLPSGIYFYKISTDGFTNVKKMILMK